MSGWLKITSQLFQFHFVSHLQINLTIARHFRHPYRLGSNSTHYDLWANSGAHETMRTMKWKQIYYVGLSFFWGNEGCAYAAESLCHTISVSEIEEILSIAIWYKGINLNMILKTNSHPEHAENFVISMFSLYFNLAGAYTSIHETFKVLVSLNLCKANLEGGPLTFWRYWSFNVSESIQMFTIQMSGQNFCFRYYWALYEQS